MPKQKPIFLLIILCLSSLFFSACTAQNQNPGAEEIIPENSIVITDAAGRQVILTKLPEKIAVTGTATYMPLHLLFMFPEIYEKLVGVEAKGNGISDFLPLIDEKYNNIPVIGQNPNAEEVASFHPDLVFMKGTTEDERCTVLEEFGIKVIYLGLETPDLFMQDIKNIGLALGNSQRAEEITSYYQEKLNGIQNIISLQAEEKPDVLLLEYSDRGGEVAVQVPAASWMQTLEVKMSGGNPVWLDTTEITDGWTVVNLEQIAVWNPDKIFVIVWYTMDPKEVLANLKSDSRWKNLAAVENDEIYIFPCDVYGWDTPEPRWILGTIWLAKKLYPKEFSDLEIKVEMSEFFSDLYGMQETEILEKIIPELRIDVN